MLHIFADALLIAMRQDPLHVDQSRRKTVADSEIKATRRWFGAKV